jgi:phosphatidylglycerol:prolipoprotein diacylglycerol transferase
MSIDQTGIHLGPVFFHFYGLILVSGAFVAGWLAAREAARTGHDPEPVWDALLWALLGGIVGARIWHILTPPPSQGVDVGYYLNLTNMLPIFQWGGINIQVPAAFAINNGGLGIPGGVIGGALAVWYFCRRRNIPFAKFVDWAAPGLVLAQAIGATSSIRSSTARRRLCPGASTSTPPIASSAIPTRPCASIRSSCTRASVTS